MKKQFINKRFFRARHYCFSRKRVFTSSLLLLIFISLNIYAQIRNSDDTMIDPFIKSKGYTQTIVFSPDNIKQYWIDKSVFSQDNTIKIILNNYSNSFDSVPLKIQLSNVDETLDCKVEVISTNKNLRFNVTNSTNKVVSRSVPEDDFIDYSIASSVFHLKDTRDFMFNLIFSSHSDRTLFIKRIILSFLNNKISFLRSPGKVILTKDNFKDSEKITFNSDGTFSKTDIFNNFVPNFYIMTNENTLTYTARVTNTGNIPSTIYTGYTLFAKGNILLDGKNFPHKGINKTANIISAQKDSATIVVDSYLEWTKDCFLSLNAKDDMSDIPSLSFANGTIANIKKMENGQAEITMSEPLKIDIKSGTKCRINGRPGSNLYVKAKVLQPGETEVFTFDIKKDESHHFFSGKIPAGVSYVMPILYSHSQDSKHDNTVQISNFTISY